MPEDKNYRMMTNEEKVREIAYQCAGAGAGAVMQLSPFVVMPESSIKAIVEEILFEIWPEVLDA